MWKEPRTLNPSSADRTVTEPIPDRCPTWPLGTDGSPEGAKCPDRRGDKGGPALTVHHPLGVVVPSPQVGPLVRGGRGGRVGAPPHPGGTGSSRGLIGPLLLPGGGPDRRLVAIRAPGAPTLLVARRASPGAARARQSVHPGRPGGGRASASPERASQRPRRL